jgi:outer membrane biosynthesis protein TonB
MIAQDVEVAVRLKIDEKGRIVDAAPVPQNHPIPGFLANIAVSAARLWRFRPARLGNRDVAADYVVVFKFNKRP